MSNIILTGLPRSGTTLLCALLNKLPNAIAMAEPMSPNPECSKEQLLNSIHAFLTESRTKALSEGVFLTKIRSGVSVDNTISMSPSSAMLRVGDSDKAYIDVGKCLSNDFNLFIKHPTLFTLLAEDLSKYYPLFASIRNPLAVLASWQTVAFSIRDGRQHMVETFDKALAARIAKIPDRIDRQVETLSWMFAVYERLGKDKIIRFEDLSSNTESQLSRIHDQIIPLNHPIPLEKIEDRYPQVDLKPLVQALRRIAPQIKNFYPDFDEELDRYEK
jgi:hypothetical protein